jgi:2-polyprenyl-3-methyl-5-hydroxy-6-metoxy-1,4-benzoquinol methylase
MISQIISHGNVSAIDLPSSDNIEAIRQQLKQFELGRFLLSNLGLNGHWTNYILRYPALGKHTGLSSDGTSITGLEKWILEECPILLATQERFDHFKTLTQSVLSSEMHLASIPCGLMNDLFSLNYDNLNDIQVTGVDLDDESLVLVQSENKPDPIVANFLNRNAWNLEIENRFDLLSSNGLNIYVENDLDCIALYREFAKSLKKEGYLVMSFITPANEWIPLSNENLDFQRFLFTQVVPVSWQCMRTEDEISAQLQLAGFKILNIIYDRQCMFPSVLAQKSS